MKPTWKLYKSRIEINQILRLKINCQSISVMGTWNSLENLSPEELDKHWIIQK